MSYIQVEIGGKLRGLKFNTMALLILQEKLRPNNAMSGAYGLVYGGLVANDYVKGNEPDYTFEQACDWADSMDQETMVKIREAFEQTEAYKKGMAYQADINASKKGEASQSFEEHKAECLEIALGKLGWSEYQYYTSSPEGFYYACRGYYAKLKEESLAVRNLSFIVYRLGGGKGDINSIWPLDNNGKTTIAPPTKEWWEKIKATQAKIDKNILDARLKNRDKR